MSFKNTLGLGKKAIVPAINNKAQRSDASRYEKSFGVTAARLWNLLPAKINFQTALEPFKIALKGYSRPEVIPTKPT